MWPLMIVQIAGEQQLGQGGGHEQLLLRDNHLPVLRSAWLGLPVRAKINDRLIGAAATREIVGGIIAISDFFVWESLPNEDLRKSH